MTGGISYISRRVTALTPGIIKNTEFVRHDGIRRLIFEARSLANHKSTRRLTSIILHIIDIYYHTLFIRVQSYLGSIFLST